MLSLGLRYIFLITILSYILDLSLGKKKCDAKTNTILFFHHFIYTFALIGWIFNEPFLNFAYMVTIPMYFILWYIHDDKCILTEIIKKKCNLDLTYNLNYMGLSTISKSHLPNRNLQRVYLSSTFVIVLIRMIKQKHL
jgi:hypothetical protein